MSPDFSRRALLTRKESGRLVGGIEIALRLPYDLPLNRFHRAQGMVEEFFTAIQAENIGFVRVTSGLFGLLRIFGREILPEGISCYLAVLPLPFDDQRSPLNQVLALPLADTKVLLCGSKGYSSVFVEKPRIAFMFAARFVCHCALSRFAPIFALCGARRLHGRFRRRCQYF